MTKQTPAEGTLWKRPEGQEWPLHGFRFKKTWKPGLAEPPWTLHDVEGILMYLGRRNVDEILKERCNPGDYETIVDIFKDVDGNYPWVYEFLTGASETFFLFVSDFEGNMKPARAL